MAMPTNTYDTFAAVGLREDLSDVVANISPSDTIFYNSLAATKATQFKHEFLLDTLRAAASNAAIEGNNITAVACTAATRNYNYCTIQTESFALTSSMMASDSAGGVTSVNYQKTKKMKELMKDVEYMFLRGVISAGVTDTTGRQMKGALNWLTSNIDKLGGSSVDGTTGVVTSAGTRDLTQDLVDSVSQSIFASGGSPKTLMCNAFQLNRIASFTGAGNYRQMVEGGKLNNYVDVYRNAFFALSVVPNRSMPTDVVFLCDYDYFKKATLQPMGMEKLGKTGLSDVYMISVEHTLECNAQAASGRIVDLTTS